MRSHAVIRSLYRLIHSEGPDEESGPSLYHRYRLFKIPR